MLTGVQHLQALRIKQASQAQDPGSAAMAAAAKAAPSAIPMPTLQFPKAEDKSADDSALKQEEAHKKELERKDKELNALRNNNQVMQVQMAHLKALAQLDKHRDQVYKSIEKKEQDHRRHMEQEDFKLQQKRERMHADEVKHKANMDVASAQQQAAAAEAQAKMTAQNAQQNAQQYIKMTQDAQRDADNYFSQKHKDLDARQKDLDAQQKKLDAEGSRISPIVMNRLQSAVKATQGLGAIREKLQGTPGINAASTMEALNKLAAADFESNPNYVIPEQLPQSTVLDRFRVTDKETKAWEDAVRAQGVADFWKRKGEAAKASGDAEGYNNALAKWREAENKRIAAITTGTGITGGRLHAENILPGTEGTEGLDTARALTYLRAADTLRGRQNAGEALSDADKLNLAQYEQAYGRLKKHFEAVRDGAIFSEKDKMNANAELALLDQYQKKHETGWLPGMPAQSQRDKVLGPGQSRNFLSSLFNDSDFKYTGEQFNRAIRSWDRGDYWNAARYGVKTLGGGLAQGLIGNPLQAVGSMRQAPGKEGQEWKNHLPFVGAWYGLANTSTYGTDNAFSDAQDIAKRFGVTIGQKGLVGGTPEAQATAKKALEQAGLYTSKDRYELGQKADVGLKLMEILPGLGTAGKALKGGKIATKALPKAAPALPKAFRPKSGWKKSVGTIAGYGSLGLLLNGLKGQGGGNVDGAVEALTKKSAAGSIPQDQGPRATTQSQMQQGNRSDNLIVQQDDQRQASNFIGRWLPYITPVAAMFGIPLGPGQPRGPRARMSLDYIARAPENRYDVYKRNNPLGLTYEGNQFNRTLTPGLSLTQQIQPNPWGGPYNV